jgi:prepilin-type N-terminal cleavage/methylation domain-containing protein
MNRYWRVRSGDKGLTLIELVVVVGIIGILAGVAIPQFLAYRNKSRVAAAVNTAESIRSALASYAVDSHGNRYPLTDDMRDWTALRAIVNAHGGTLKATPAAMGIETIAYTSDDGMTYVLQLTVNVPENIRGRTLSVTPAGITRE